MAASDTGGSANARGGVLSFGGVPPVSRTSVAFSSGFNSTKAQGVSPHLSSGLATTAAACTAGCL